MKPIVEPEGASRLALGGVRGAERALRAVPGRGAELGAAGEEAGGRPSEWTPRAERRGTSDAVAGRARAV